jgi:hypothetical protein
LHPDGFDVGEVQNFCDCLYKIFVVFEILLTFTFIKISEQLNNIIGLTEGNTRGSLILKIMLLIPR